MRSPAPRWSTHYRRLCEGLGVDALPTATNLDLQRASAALLRVAAPPNRPPRARAYLRGGAQHALTRHLAAPHDTCGTGFGRCHRHVVACSSDSRPKGLARATGTASRDNSLLAKSASVGTTRPTRAVATRPTASSSASTAAGAAVILRTGRPASSPAAGRGVSEGRSSTGRAPVSKTGGWGFESLRPCQLMDVD